MQTTNCCYKYSKIAEVKFGYLVRLFALDLTAPDAARLTGLSVRAVHDVYLRLRHRLLAGSPVPADLDGAVELDESYFASGAYAANEAEEPAAKPVSLACLNAGPSLLYGKHPRVLEKDSTSHYSQ